MNEVNLMSGNETELKFTFEQDVPSIDGLEHGIPVSTMSRPVFLAGGTAVGASLLLGRMALAESLWRN
jgi:hypothetical protein